LAAGACDALDLAAADPVGFASADFASADFAPADFAPVRFAAADFAVAESAVADFEAEGFVSDFWASASTLLMTVVSSVLGVSAFFSGSALTSGVGLAAEDGFADVAADLAGADFAGVDDAEG